MSEVVKTVERWLTSVVIQLNLCPFAQREYRSGRVRFKESVATSEEDLLKDLVVELSLLTRRPEIETTLLIHPQVLTEFERYNQFLDFADSVIQAMHLEGSYQIASFHPDYQFADTDPADVTNYTNRSPYPILHILREQSLEHAIEQHSDTSRIPQDNMRLMRELGTSHMLQLLKECQAEDHS